MTTDDIATMQVIMIAKDGSAFVANVNNEMTKNIVAGTCQFVQVDESKVCKYDIKEFVKNN